MWQIFAILSLVATALQGVADKWAIVSDRHIDISVATFWRNALTFLFTFLVGVWGILGPLSWYFDPLILVGALLLVCSAHFYTYMLRHVEVTNMEMDNYIAPLAFLAIDVLFINVPLSKAEMIGVVFLAIGGFLMTIDARSRQVKREFTPRVFGIVFFWVIYGGFQFYLFKHLHASEGLNSVSFLASTYIVTVALLLLIVVLRGKYRALFSRSAAAYLPPVMVSKVFDTAAGLFAFTALMYASASQVAAIGALLPLVILVVAVFVQKETRFNIRERVDRANIFSKLFAITLLCVGIYLVS